MLALFAVTHTLFGVLIIMCITIAVVTLLMIVATVVHGYFTKHPK